MSLNQNIDSIGGYGGFGMGGGGGLLGFILGAALTGGRNGNGLFGGGGDCNGGNLAYQAGVNAGSAAQYRDVVQATSQINQNVDNQFLTTFGALNAGFERTQSAIADTKDAISQQTIAQSAQFAAVNQNLCQLGHNMQMGFASTQNMLQSESCAIKQAIHADGEATRALINQANTQALRDKVNELERQRDLLATGNFPIGRPATVVFPDPCSTSRNSDQINIINQNVNAIGSQVAQLASAFNGLAARSNGAAAK